MKRPKLKACSKLWAWVDEDGFIILDSISGTKRVVASKMIQSEQELLSWGWTLRKIKIEERP